MHLSGQGNKPYFITKNLKKYPIKYSVWKILANKVLLCSAYTNFKTRLGLVSIENKLVLPFKFDNYVRNIHDTKVDEIEHVDFIEYPILIKDGGVIKKTYIDYNSYTSKDHLIHRYSLSDYTLVSTSLIKGAESHQEYIFSSAEEYNYKSFYDSIADLLSDHRISYDEFDTLKSKLRVVTNTGSSNLKSVINDFKIRKKVEAEFAAKQQTAANKEGCYIATLAYESYEHPNVRVLRKFRDNKLNKSAFGKLFVSYYYQHSPRFVKYAAEKRILIGASRKILDVIVALVRLRYSEPTKTKK